MPDIPAPNLQRPINRIMKIPFQISTDGSIAFVVNPYEIAGQYLRMMILTRLKERIMRPTYGTRAIDSVFESNDEFLQGRLISDIRDVVLREEPSIIITGIQVGDGNPVVGVLTLYVSFELAGVEGASTVTLEFGQVIPIPIP